MNNFFPCRLGPLKPISDIEKPGQYVYKFQFQAQQNEKLTIIPESSILLFTPSHLSIIGPPDCVELQDHIVAKRGIRLEGRIDPPLKDVKISIINEYDEIILSMFTDNEGRYKFTPLHSDHRYR